MKCKLFILFFSLSYSLYSMSSEEIIKRKYYTLNYNEDHEIANWVSYELDHEKLQNCANRRNNFRPDPSVSTGSATIEDYKNSGFDRGHLVPAGDMKISIGAMSDTFFLSNITPQPGSFNRGPWVQLENLMRFWALKYKKIWIVTGPILKDNLKTIGASNRISIPEQYFKVILKKSSKGFEGIGFILETDNPSRNLKSYITTIDEIEEQTKTNFFQFLKAQEEEVESKSNVNNWEFNGKFEYFPCRS